MSGEGSRFLGSAGVGTAALLNWLTLRTATVALPEASSALTCASPQLGTASWGALVPACARRSAPGGLDWLNRIPACSAADSPHASDGQCCGLCSRLWQLADGQSCAHGKDAASHAGPPQGHLVARHRGHTHEDVWAILQQSPSTQPGRPNDKATVLESSACQDATQRRLHKRKPHVKTGRPTAVCDSAADIIK